MLEIASVLIMFCVLAIGVYEIMCSMKKRRWGENYKNFF